MINCLVVRHLFPVDNRRDKDFLFLFVIIKADVINFSDTINFIDGPTDGEFSEDDTLSMDSLQLAVWRHNKAVDDSLREDSINRAKEVLNCMAFKSREIA